MKIEWYGDEIAAKIRSNGARAVGLAAEHILAESRKIVPIDEATLSRSGATSVDASLMRASVSYDTPYAVRQHEELGYRHAPGRTAKYLERAMHEHRGAVAKIMNRALKW